MEELEVEWTLTEDNEIPGSSHMFWRKVKGGVIYKSRRKHSTPPRVWREQVVRVLHQKAVDATDGARNLVLLHIEEEYVGRLVFKTWSSHTLSACPNAKFRLMAMILGTAAPIRDQVCWQGNRKVLYWRLFTTAGKQDPWVIAPEVVSPTGFMLCRLLFKEKCCLWDYPDDLWQHMNEQQLVIIWRDLVDILP